VSPKHRPLTETGSGEGRRVSWLGLGCQGAYVGCVRKGVG
jgi:hypothetical protein